MKGYRLVMDTGGFLQICLLDILLFMTNLAFGDQDVTFIKICKWNQPSLSYFSIPVVSCRGDRYLDRYRTARYTNPRNNNPPTGCSTGAPRRGINNNNNYSRPAVFPSPPLLPPPHLHSLHIKDLPHCKFSSQWGPQTSP